VLTHSYIYTIVGVCNACRLRQVSSLVRVPKRRSDSEQLQEPETPQVKAALRMSKIITLVDLNIFINTGTVVCRQAYPKAALRRWPSELRSPEKRAKRSTNGYVLYALLLGKR
jgi:hypothetical protein